MTPPATTPPATATATSTADPEPDLARFTHNRYLIRRKIFKIFGESFHIYDVAGNVVLYSKLKAFKLREDIRLYASEAMERELLVITTQQILDIGATYEVVDPVSGEKLGGLRRKGIKSTFVRDEWAILDAAGEEIGTVREDSTVKALVRRFVDWAAFVMPQKYHVRMGDREVMTLQQNFNPFVQKIDLEFAPGAEGMLDRRLGLATGVLMAAIEGRQE